MRLVQAQQVRPSLLRTTASATGLALLGVFLLATADGGFARVAGGLLLIAGGVGSIPARWHFELSFDGRCLHSRSLWSRRVEIPIEAARIEHVPFGLVGRSEHLIAGPPRRTSCACLLCSSVGTTKQRSDSGSTPTRGRGITAGVGHRSPPGAQSPSRRDG
jgi:hypothetical protein